MHRTDAAGNVANQFTDGPPSANATLVDAAWLNDVQENVCQAVEGGGIALIKGTGTQLLSAIRRLVGLPDTVDCAAAVAMDKDTARVILANPAAAYAQALPTGATIKKGYLRKLKNLSTVAGRIVTMNSSGGDLVWAVYPGNEGEFIALQDNPTTGAHWAVSAILPDFVDCAAAIAMDITTPRTILATPGAAYAQALPTGAAIKEGYRRKLKNLSAVAGRNVTLNSSGGNLVWVVCPGNECEFIALQDNPTTGAHWTMLNRGWPIHARVHKSADQTAIAEGTLIKVTFNTVDFDPAGIFNDANDRFILNLPGVWELRGGLQFLLSGAGAEIVQGGFKLNGAALVSGDGQRSDIGASNNTRWRIPVLGEVVVTTPNIDYVELNASYNDAGAVDAGIIQAFSDATLFSTAAATWMSAKYLGPL
jgi:predicted secreted protein